MRVQVAQDPRAQSKPSLESQSQNHSQNAVCMCTGPLYTAFLTVNSLLFAREWSCSHAISYPCSQALLLSADCGRHPHSAARIATLYPAPVTRVRLELNLYCTVRKVSIKVIVTTK